MQKLKSALPYLQNRYFSEKLDFRALIFNLLGIIGVVLGITTSIISLATGAAANAIINAAVSAAAVILLRVANETQKFKQCYLVTITAVFVVAYPVMFFAAGGYHSAMPCYFVFAVAFSAMMLKGKTRTVMTALLMAL